MITASIYIKHAMPESAPSEIVPYLPEARQ